MFFRKKENVGFKNIGLAMIGIVFLIIIGNIPPNLYKIVMIFLIPLLTSPLIFQRLNIKNRETLEKNLKIILLVLSIEIITIAQLFFLGMPELPFFISPFNNLFFWGIILTIVCSTFWKKEEYNKGIIKSILIITWTSIVLYQFIINYDKIKEMW